ncbi:MAG: PAS domain-containing hybrid sensor histidine kinase/response regulator [Roseiflexus sp.]
MSEPERSNDPSHDSPSLASQITVVLMLASLLALVNITLFFVSGDLTGAAIAVIAACTGLFLALARHLALRTHRYEAIMLFAAALALGTVVTVWIEPASTPVAVLIPPLILITMLQHLRTRDIGPLIATVSLVSVALTVIGETARPWFVSSDPLVPAIRAAAVIIAILLLAAMLWNYGLSLRTTLARLEAVNAALRESEARYRSVVEDHTELICRAQPDGTVTLINSAGSRVWGLKRDEIVGNNLRHFIHPDDIPPFNHHLASLTPESPVSTIEHRTVMPDGETRWQRWTTRALYDGDRLIGYQVVGRDVTEYRRAEEQVLRSERQFKAIAENAPDLIIRYDLQQRHLYVNPAFEQATGLSGASVIGKTYRDIGAPENIAHRLDECLQAVLMSGTAQTTAFDTPTPLGIRFYEARIVPESGPNGDIESFLAIMRDITERRHHELAMLHRQKLESTGVMAQGIAHEFNNLLAIILNNAELTLTTLAPHSPERLSVEAIASAGRRAATITRQMQTYIGDSPLQTTLLNLNDLIEEMKELLQASITRSIALTYHLSDADPLVEGDAAQMRQVILNLTINAAESIGDRNGEVVISTDVRSLDRAFLATTIGSDDLSEGEYAVLTVSDNGCGMDAFTLERIFDPFFTTKFIGRGLGLPATLGIVRGHRGAIRVTSTPGEGTTVTVSLPAVYKPPIHVGTFMPEMQMPITRIDCSRIFLIVDDEENMRAVAARMLEWMGRPALTTGDVETAVILARQHRAHLACVLLDLPADHTLAQAVGQFRQVCAHVPIVLMSGYPEAIASRRFAYLGLSGFLQKPFTSYELRSVIDTVAMIDHLTA